MQRGPHDKLQGPYSQQRGRIQPDKPTDKQVVAKTAECQQTGHQDTDRTEKTGYREVENNAGQAGNQKAGEYFRTRPFVNEGLCQNGFSRPGMAGCPQVLIAEDTFFNLAEFKLNWR